MSEALPSSDDVTETMLDAPFPPPAFVIGAYEEDRTQSALGALEANYAEAIEFAPVVSEFTTRLARRCTRLISSATGAPIDPASLAIGARDPFASALIPSALPARPFNLIVFTDLLSELSDPEVSRVTDYALATLAPRGHLLLVHWLSPRQGGLDGDAAAERLIARAGESVQPLLRRRMPHYRIDLLERA